MIGKRYLNKKTGTVIRVDAYTYRLDSRCKMVLLTNIGDTNKFKWLSIMNWNSILSYSSNIVEYDDEVVKPIKCLVPFKLDI